jgi:hypothetical protein
MSLTLRDVQRIATDIAENEAELEVVGAIPSEGDATYAEVVFVVTDSPAGPQRLVVGVSRNTTELACRAAVETQLHQRLTAD